MSQRTLSFASIVLVVALLCAASESHAQHLTSVPHRGVVQVPVGSEVYSYLRHLSVRGMVKGYSEVELPISEYEVVGILESADTNNLSVSERALRTKFLRTYAHIPDHVVSMFPARNAEPLFFSGIVTDADKYLYRWTDDSTQSEMYVHGIASLEMRRRQKPDPASVVLGVFGGQFSGTLSGHVGFFLEATNGQDFGDSSVALEDPLLASNKNFALFSKKDFDFTSAELSYNYDWFTAKLAREAVQVGGSYQGDNIILSSNVPTYDFLSLGAHVGHVRYQAMIGSLLGDARVSEGFDTTRPDQIGGSNVHIDPKYLTLHDLSFVIGEDIELGFTDMVIYSRRFDLAYANPFSFLKSVEHSLVDRDNGLLAVHGRWKITDGFEVRGEGVVDDVKASEIGKGFWANKFAWQFGGMWTNPFGINDLDLMAELTRIEPYTFSHFLQQNTFASSRTLLSNHIGPNSISYWTSARWAPSEKWTAQIEATFIRRGENLYDSTGLNIIKNYGADFETSIGHGSEMSDPIYILDGRRVDILSLTGIVQFEPWRGLFVFARGTNKMVHYLLDNPNPREHPETQFAIGARALF